MSVLTDYKVEFQNRVKVGKIILTIDENLSAYVYSHNSINRVNQLLNLVNITLAAPSGSESRSPTQGMDIAIITPTETKIYDSIDNWGNNLPPDFVLPTAHFKVIVEAWRDYLQ